ncbi:MAG: efflux RND transporter periplasmic adaptor subunit [Deferribacteraceae bacterium]|jgi:membrane fusion protein (multidrug efflux system)|nr:efflux RND transporter periplasmic adaptor subunit [Deferribacteraceae bacterium]
MTEKMRKNIFILLLIPFVWGCKGGEKNEVRTAVIKPVEVVVTPVMKRDIKDEYTLPGLVEAWDVVTASVEISGHVKSIMKKEGDAVKAGETILKINTDTVESGLKSSGIQLEMAKKDYGRAESLYNNDAISQKSFDDASDRLQLMKVNYKQARDFYNKSMAISPIEGVIDRIIPETGEFVSAGQPIVTIVRADKLKIQLNIPEKDHQYLNLGQTVEIYPDNINSNGLAIEASIGYISVTSNPQTLAYRARVDTEPGEGIAVGKIVRVKIERQVYSDAFVIPLYALMDIDGKKIVYIENNGFAKRTEVSVGVYIGTDVVITSGLNDGDRLITTGQQFLYDNIPVRVTE